MQITEYIKPELLVLIPVLYAIGYGIKKTKNISNKYIPLILGAIGIVFCTFYVLATSDIAGYKSVLYCIFTVIVQGILCAAGATYVNQIYKQSKEDE